MSWLAWSWGSRPIQQGAAGALRRAAEGVGDGAGEVGELFGEVEVPGEAGLVEAGGDEADLAAQRCYLRGQGGAGVPGR